MPRAHARARGPCALQLGVVAGFIRLTQRDPAISTLSSHNQLAVPKISFWWRHDAEMIGFYDLDSGHELPSARSLDD